MYECRIAYEYLVIPVKGGFYVSQAFTWIFTNESLYYNGPTNLDWHEKLFLNIKYTRSARIT